MTLRWKLISHISLYITLRVTGELEMYLLQHGRVRRLKWNVLSDDEVQEHNLSRHGERVGVRK